MDFKDVILLGGGILIAVFIWHGMWMAWRSRRDPLRMKLAPELSSEESEEIDEMSLFKGELPNGKSRVIGRKAIQPSLLYNDNDKPSESDSTNEFNGEIVEVPSRLPSDTPSELKPFNTRAASPSIRSQPKEPTFELTPPSGPFKFQPDSYREAKFEAEKPAIESSAIRSWESNHKGSDEILVLSVMSRTGGRWNGEELFRLLQEKELKFGDMNIFHRLEATSKNTLYSVANALEPGIFDLSRLNQMHTPGISMFMQLPGPQDPLAAFDEMMEVAHSIAAGMNGELRDEFRNVMTSQTIAYYRQRIEDFTRRSMQVKAS